MNATLAHYRGRFAPTPSGPLHFGSLVAAAASYLEARTHAGQWQLRIDDLDPLRVAPGAIDAILRCLETLGFEWDGAIQFQSARRDAYHAALHRLRQHGAVYPCVCSRREIAATALSSTEGPIYPGTCRDLQQPGRARCWRIDTRAALIEFDDGVQGRQRHALDTQAGDFTLYRADGVYSFHLAAALDDAQPGITDVVRGTDLLHSSARQIFLQRLLALRSPRYLHVPVALDEQGEKLSKQTRATPIAVERPAATLTAVLRFLGQQPPVDLEIVSCREFWVWAAAHWNVERVARAPSLPAPVGA